MPTDPLKPPRAEEVLVIVGSSPLECMRIMRTAMLQWVEANSTCHERWLCRGDCLHCAARKELGR